MRFSHRIPAIQLSQANTNRHETSTIDLVKTFTYHVPVRGMNKHRQPTVPQVACGWLLLAYKAWRDDIVFSNHACTYCTLVHAWYISLPYYKTPATLPRCNV
ncbi:hypothetical protein PoMZ_11650 [Pyricularia oryzae]|uniref:Uncharacterized protein n=1 Tax=Pyricularia oryzae TaxID=318829 RepID=A0A4P7NKX8_PYROR|nr:hypothetical protein PoMZ_11650 [Pyricularia oryzae]